MISDEDLELLETKLSDKWWRISNLYSIKDKKGREVPFVPNKAQTRYFQARHTRNIILKARQQGFTTLAAIDALDDAMFRGNFDAGIIAHTLEDAEKIFTNKVRFAFDRLPEAFRVANRPNTDRSGEMRFEHASSLSVSSGFRGGTLQKLHVSEMGKISRKYPDKAREIILGALNAVPLEGEVTIESTAEGMDGEFYELCERAQNHTGPLTAMDFKFHFFPWHESDEYKLTPSGIEISLELQAYFEMLEREHAIKLDAHQRAWYAKKREEQGAEMHQEYPSYPEEAFLASGRPFFDQIKISGDIRRAKEKRPLRGFIDEDGKFSETPVGTVLVYEMPKLGAAYAIGADCAEGLEDGDSSTASVLNRDFNQCATYCGKMDPDTFGSFLVNLGKFYNNAVLAPELNNHGHTVLSAIKRRGYHWIYRREVKEEHGEEKQDKLGWLNTVKSKMQMIDELRAAQRDGSLTINDEATLREMLKVSIEEDGNVILNGKDRTVALGVSIQAIKQAILGGQHKAFIPGRVAPKDVTKMSIPEKMAYYKRTHK